MEFQRFPNFRRVGGPEFSQGDTPPTSLFCNAELVSNGLSYFSYERRWVSVRPGRSKSNFRDFLKNRGGLVQSYRLAGC